MKKALVSSATSAPKSLLLQKNIRDLVVFLAGQLGLAVVVYKGEPCFYWPVPHILDKSSHDIVVSRKG